MRTPNECWMDLHRLAASLAAEGLTREERLDNTMQEFLALPLLVRRELLKELRFLLAELPALEPLVANAADDVDDAKAPSKTAG
jgi:hypothetical protein